jgi:hypothetical protein
LAPGKPGCEVALEPDKSAAPPLPPQAVDIVKTGNTKVPSQVVKDAPPFPPIEAPEIRSVMPPCPPEPPAKEARIIPAGTLKMVAPPMLPPCPSYGKASLLLPPAPPDPPVPMKIL